MPFRLKNAGATYQRCMNTVFGELIGRTVEAYVDYIVVKSKHANNIIDDLGLAFVTL
jgi:DNA-directed RNA polymerase subunit N (RpoN/RPB10)